MVRRTRVSAIAANPTAPVNNVVMTVVEGFVVRVDQERCVRNRGNVCQTPVYRTALVWNVVRTAAAVSVAPAVQAKPVALRANVWVGVCLSAAENNVVPTGVAESAARARPAKSVVQQAIVKLPAVCPTVPINSAVTTAAVACVELVVRGSSVVRKANARPAAVFRSVG